jgi:ankyrin repeat protein
MNTYRTLTNTGADVRSAMPGSGDTPLHFAARKGHPVPAICLLIKAGADLTALNREGQTPAQAAAAAGHELLESLLNRAAREA